MSYWFYFRHPVVPELLPVKAEGPTYCRAKNAAFDTLEAFLATPAGQQFPRNGWGIDHADPIFA